MPESSTDSSDPPRPGGDRNSARLAELAAAAGQPESNGVKQRARDLAALVPLLTSSAKQAGVRAVAAGHWISDTVLDMVPRLTVRDAPALRRAYPGRTDADIGEALVTSASRTTAAIGAAAGTLAAVEFTAPPALLATPVQLAAETLAVVAVEVRLVAELHAIAGLAVPGPMLKAGPAYLTAWVRRSPAVAGDTAPTGEVLAATVVQELRRRLMRRVGRSAISMAPFMAGAVAGAEVNRRSTRELGEKMRAQLATAQRSRADIVIEAASPEN